MKKGTKKLRRKKTQINKLEPLRRLRALDTAAREKNSTNVLDLKVGLDFFLLFIIIIFFPQSRFLLVGLSKEYNFRISRYNDDDDTVIDLGLYCRRPRVRRSGVLIS